MRRIIHLIIALTCACIIMCGYAAAETSGDIVTGSYGEDSRIGVPAADWGQKIWGQMVTQKPQNPTTDNRCKAYKTMYKNRITYVII